MVTRTANLMNLATPVQKTLRGTESAGETLTESFQAYVAGSSASFKGQTSRMMNENPSVKAETNHKEVYEAQKAGKDSYSVSGDSSEVDTNIDGEVQTDALTEEEGKALEDKIRAVLKKTMGLDDEELDSMLAELNLNVLQLLQPENLQQLMLTATESEPVDLLTNPEMNTILRELSTEITAAVKEITGKNVEDLTQIDPDMLASMEEGPKATEELPKAKDNLSATASEAKEDFGNTFEAQAEVAEVTDAPQTLSKESPRETSKEDDVNVASKDEISIKEEKTGVEVQVKTSQTGREKSEGRENHQQFAANVVQQLGEAVTQSVEAVTPVSYTSGTEQIEIVQQLVERIRLESNESFDRIELQLYPQHLGKIQLQVMMKNGVMTAQIHAETEAAKQAIEGQLQTLKETFEAKGMKVEAVEVDVNTAAFDENRDRQNRDAAGEQPEDKTTKGRREIRLDEFGMPTEELTEEEAVEATRLAAEGGSVEYRA